MAGFCVVLAAVALVSLALPGARTALANERTLLAPLRSHEGGGHGPASLGPKGGTSLSSDQERTLIVPSARIGLARLGMNRAMIKAVNRDSLCPVDAAYDAAGRAMWLQTNWGGSCLISDTIQVGLLFGPARQAFGRPDQIAEDARYPNAVAWWTRYDALGIAFRILGQSPGALIQSIAVFPGSAFRQARAR